MNRILFILFFLFVWSATITWAQTPATHKIIGFEAPGAGQGQNQGTAGEYIGADGSIVGTYYHSNSIARGFLRNSDGTFATFDPSGSAGTYPCWINSAHVIVGRYADIKGVMHGFIRSATGNITSYNAPGAGNGPDQGTFLVGINKSGEMLGYYIDVYSAYHGFLLTPSGHFTQFDAPGAGTGPFQGTLSAGITDTGAVAGTMMDSSSVSHGFIRETDGNFTEFDVNSNTFGTHVSGINSSQTVAGTSIASGPSGGFLRAADGQITLFGNWSPYGIGNINASGVITGSYSDSQQVAHGWVRTPNGNITYFDAPRAGKSAYQGTIAFTVNDSNEITGYYVDPNGVLHGFIVE